ncbi:ran-binding protein 3 isoform X2 [Ochotona princeps]|uniref:ran-binding protein 3 isoform X2 n=1 Tax=Ochotona princeps TaxID=9978 RepID=UPI002714C813|nr:ran-binding protein 3 isoform X2 [Ochotona princeps]XP_058515862.1 ran-binding protein 3 isoform X2 [Ochotona princeps]
MALVPGGQRRPHPSFPLPTAGPAPAHLNPCSPRCDKRPEKPALAPPVFVFQKDKGQKSSTEQKGLSDSGEEAEAPHRGPAHPPPAGERALEPPGPANTSSSTPPPPDPEARLPPLPQELAGRSAGGSSPEGGEDSDREDGNYCPPVKRERTSSLTQLPHAQPEEKSSGFRLKPPTLIHGQAPSAASCVAGLPSQKPKEQQRSVLRPAVLQAPPPKALPQSIPNSGTNGVSILADCTGARVAASPDSPARRSPSEYADDAQTHEESQRKEPSRTSEEEEEDCEKREQVAQQAFVFGQNLRDRVKLLHENADAADADSAGQPSSDTPAATNYFLQYMSSSLENSTNSADSPSNKFVFGQNMSERVLSFPKLNEVSSEASRELAAADSGSESSSQEATPEKESLAESAAAYTKATARKCLLEKVEVITGEEAESNVLQIQCKLFVFDKSSQSWVERGRGLLRLNDMASTDDGTLQSRLVMRTQGSLRLILNTKLWAQMQIDKASEKSIRITAMDTEDQGVKVFLISASSKDTGQLYAALHHRILALRSRVEQEQEAKTPAPEPGAAPSNEEDDSDDDNMLAPSGAAAAGAGEEGEGQTAGST